MINIFSKKNRIECTSMENAYKHRIRNELCFGYSYFLGGENGMRDFFAFEPTDCNISKLVNRGNYNNSNDMERLIGNITYRLMFFGKAYIYIKPDYTINIDNEHKEQKILSSLKLEEINGGIKGKNKTHFKFCCREGDGKTSDIQICRKQLIIFDIKDLGYNKNYFPSVLKKLGKCDIALSAVTMLSSNSDGYDFDVHSKKSKLRKLKVLKDVGWVSDASDLSDSYILYKKIQEDKIRICFLNYILQKLNSGFEKYIVDVGGKLVAHINEKNYDQLWKDYCEGKLTGTELTKILYPK